MLLPRLRYVRERTLMTRRALAAASGVSTNTIHRAEHGLPVELRTIRKLADALGVEPTELMAPEKRPRRPEAAA
jgi:transcriptional regulator with XRE-family HTH domain